MQELDKKLTFRLDKQTLDALNELVSLMNARSKFHVLHTQSDAVRYSIRTALRNIKKEKEEASKDESQQ